MVTTKDAEPAMTGSSLCPSVVASHASGFHRFPAMVVCPPYYTAWHGFESNTETSIVLDDPNVVDVGGIVL